MQDTTQSTVQANRRSGFTIAELLFAISAILALSVLAMTVVGLLLTSEQRSAEALWVDVTIANLAADLREDAHLARDIQSVGEQNGRIEQITLLQGNEVRVTYECTADVVVRRRQQQGDVLASETYRLAFGTSWFEPPKDDRLLTWRHEREIPSIGGYSQPTPEKAVPTRSCHIDALIGLHTAMAGKEQE